jgi:acetyl esterase/lipase
MTMMKWGKRIAVLFVISVLGWRAYVAWTQPPIVQGKLEYNITYKEGKSMDIYYPTKRIGETSPVVFFIHGGGWIAGRKESINMNRFNGAISTLRSEGFTVISPAYTLATPERGAFPDCIQDVIDAIDYSVMRSEEFRLDTTRMGIFGESAGAHIAMMVGFGGGVDSFPKIPKMDYVVDVYGPTNLHEIYRTPLVDSLEVWASKLPESLRGRADLAQQIIGFNPKEDTAKAYRIMDFYSPIRYVDAQSPPTLIVQGEADIVVPPAQSYQLDSALNQNHVNYKTLYLPGVNHAFIGATSDQRKEIQNTISHFVLTHYVVE